MGNGSSIPRVVIHTEPQKTFAANRLEKEATSIVRDWFEDGAPLGLTFDLFKQVFQAGADVTGCFQTFDTDGNEKVDAFEVLAVAVLLAQGPLPDKIEMLFAIFDLSAQGILSFDEAVILLGCVCRGLSKVCELPVTSDSDVMQAARQMYDAHNLVYEKPISKEQVKRWIRNDIEASVFIDSIQRALNLHENLTEVERLEQAQAAAYRECAGAGGAGGGPTVDELFQNPSVLQSLSDPSQEVLSSVAGALRAALAASGVSTVSRQRYREMTRSWDAFLVLDSSDDGFVDAKELRNLLWLARDPGQEQPPAKLVEEKLEDLKCGSGGKITLAAWLQVALAGLN
eukprot:TRINITY_DN27568_c0_g1_i1.p1 TRINITY_DN27568_c0_g1~~TRINITY_DN27568_c0_g1_i1.p1  ORF type:complete len:342 (+),score=76.85 TRINITY_DN27568_c0_g1_i1:158-1183(+)